MTSLIYSNRAVTKCSIRVFQMYCDSLDIAMLIYSINILLYCIKEMLIITIWIIHSYTAQLTAISIACYKFNNKEYKPGEVPV